MSGNVPLWFPDGVPEGIRRIDDPDVVHRRVQKGVKDLVDRKWSRMAPVADKIARGQRSWWKRLFIGSPEVDPKWLTHALYRPRDWPPGLTQEEKDKLAVLRRLRDMGNYRTKPLKPEDLDNAPTRDQILDALKMMVLDFGPTLSRIWSSYNDMLYRVGSEIEPLCEQAYDEPCYKGEGAGLVAGDVDLALRINAFRGVISPGGNKLLMDFLRLYRRA